MSNAWFTAGHQQWCSVNLTPEQFSFRVNTPVTKHMDFQLACDYTADVMFREWNDRPWYLSLSGGLDSELVAETLLKNKIPFTPVILKVGELNAAESWYAEYWCNKHQITPIVKNLTVEEYEDIFKKYLPHIRHTHQTGIVAYLYLADEIESMGGYNIHGVGDINQHNDHFYCNVVDFALDMFRPGQHPTGFFIYTAELALAYIKEFDMLLNEQYNKCKFYNIVPRPKIEWVTQIKNSSERLLAMHKLWWAHVANANPHWFGNQQQTISVLQGMS